MWPLFLERNKHMVKNKNLIDGCLCYLLLLLLDYYLFTHFSPASILALQTNILIMPRYKFVGLANYKAVLSDPNFYNAFFNSLKWTAFSLLGQVLVGFVLALALHRVRRFKKYIGHY